MRQPKKAFRTALTAHPLALWPGEKAEEKQPVPHKGMERKYLISKTVCPGGCCSKMLIEQAQFRSRTYSVKCLIVHIFALVNGGSVQKAGLTAVKFLHKIFLGFFKKARRRNGGLVWKHSWFYMPLLQWRNAGQHQNWHQNFGNGSGFGDRHLGSRKWIYCPHILLLLLFVGYLPLNIPTLILHKAPIKLRELTLLWGKGGGGTFYKRYNCQIEIRRSKFFSPSLAGLLPHPVWFLL